MPLALAIFLAFAGVGSVHGLRNAEPIEVVSVQDRPSWCENRASFGASRADKKACGW